MGILSIVFFGGGEPLLHNDLGKLLRHSAESGIATALNTNGILLDRFKDDVAISCCWTRVSLDASSSSTFRKLHEGRDYFDRIIANVRALNEVAVGTVGISFVVMEENVHDMVAAAHLARSLNCDFIQFKPLYQPNPNNERRISYMQSVMKNQAIQQLTELETTFDDRFEVLITGSLKAALSDSSPMQLKSYSYCAAQQLIPLVTPHGVYICPNWRGATSKRYGDVMRDSFSTVWNSTKHKEIAAETNPSRDCDLFCLRHQTNVIMDASIRAQLQGLDLLSLLQVFPSSDLLDRHFL